LLISDLVQPEVPFVRTHHAIGAVVGVILIGIGVKLFFFSVPAAQAYTHAAEGYSMNVLQMHFAHPNRKNLPVQKGHDMSFVFSDPN
jgi:hypothetical protein